MKTSFIFLFIFSYCATAAQSGGTWVWIKGDSVLNSAGNYGTMGVPSPNNSPPASYARAYWTDTAYNLWLYGPGYDFGTDPIGASDLWQFNSTTQLWTWICGSNSNPNIYIASPKGVYNSANSPGSKQYGPITWVTPNNHLWLFGGACSCSIITGGSGYVSTDNNLWQYDPSINQWAWMGTFGPTNYGTKGIGTFSTMPGGRTETSAAWVDNSGNLWLWGGSTGVNDYNDLWKYDVVSGIWTWMSGSNIANDPGLHGALGVPSINYYPSSRSTNFTWQDDSGAFWLVGGFALNTNFFYQDIWKFNPGNLEWTLIKGSPAPDNSKSSYGEICDTSYNKKEGAWHENRASGKICENLIINWAGNLWGYIPSMNTWTLIDSLNNIGYSYGAQGIPNRSNFPPNRGGTASFIDRQKNFWVFGGYGGYNDLWEYILDRSCVIAQACEIRVHPKFQTSTTVTNVLCAGACNGAISVATKFGFSPYTYHCQPTNQTSATINNLCSGDYTIRVSDSLGYTVVDSIFVGQPAPLQVTASTVTIPCNADSIHISISATGGIPPYQGIGSLIAHVGPNNYVISDSNSCSVIYNVNVNHSVPPLATISSHGDTLLAHGSAESYQWLLNDSIITGAVEAFYIPIGFGNYSVEITDSNGCTAISAAIVITRLDAETETTDITIFPNPNASGVWEISISKKELLGGKLELYSSDGRLVFTSQVLESYSKIQLISARAGLYLLRLTSSDYYLEKKLILL